MPLDVPVITDRHIVLPVRAVVAIERLVMLGGEELAAAVLDEEAGKLEVAPLPGGVPELDERQLEFRVAGITQALVGAERRVDVIGQLRGDVQEIPSAVAQNEPRRLRSCARHSTARDCRGGWSTPARLLHDVVAIEIAVGKLGRGERGDDGVEPLLQRLVGVGGQASTTRPRAPCRRPDP